GPGVSLAAATTAFVNPSAGLAELERLRAVWPRALFVKGILNGPDAVRALDAGADGIIVSNHGGRQLDGALAAIEALEEVVAHVAGRAPVVLDGGVRRGTDVVKALALGAAACMIGRPWLYGVAAAGQTG